MSKSPRARPPFAALAAALVLLATVTLYGSLASAGAVPSPETTSRLTAPAYAFLVVLALALVVSVWDLLRYSRSTADALRKEGVIPLSPAAIIPYVVSQKRYAVAFAASSVLYGLVYSVLTSVIAYRPDLDFGALPGLSIPSVQPVNLLGAPLYVPEVTVFVTNHIALVLIPVTLLMLVAVAGLVGVNVSLALFAFDNRLKGKGITWGGQLGAVVALFTGCPTCAGLYFFSVLGGSGAVSFAVVLGTYQPFFILLSVPVLLLSPYLTSRSLAKVFRDGCVVVPASHHLS